MNNDDISIVLAVYNGEKYLEAMLTSVVLQKHINIKELIIVDDCSSDNSVKIIKNFIGQYSFIRFIKNEINQGPIQSFINGAKLADGEYIAFADQDDIWKENKLHLTLKLIKDIKAKDKPSVVFTDLEVINDRNQKIAGSFWKMHNIQPHRNNFFTLLFGNVITGCTMLINRKMRDEFIKMPKGVVMHDHWVALIATSIGNWNFSEEKTVLYRLHDNSVTNKDYRTLGQKISDFLKVTFNNKSDYLNNYINQAILFEKIYGAILDDKLNKNLDYFIKLQSIPNFLKKLKSKFRFFLSNSMHKHIC